MMVLASYHIIKDILETLEGGDLDSLQDMCDKFCERYPQDDELQKIICGESSAAFEYITSGDEKSRQKLKSELQDLMNIRHMETSGGERLWFKDRRS